MEEPKEIFVLNKSVRLLQPIGGFRTSLDSVMLAAACPAKGEQTILDMGCGVGSAAFCLAYRVNTVHITGVDIQKDYIELASRNAVLNNFEDKTNFLVNDIRDFFVKDKNERFHQIMCNPPYLEAGKHCSSPREGVAKARGHSDSAISLKNWIDKGFELLKPGGALTMIHRADSTDKLIRLLGNRFGAVEIIPLWPKQGKDAKRVVIRALKDRKSPCVFRRGLVIHSEDGVYTKEAEHILREAKSLY